ncbi:unnamed protein product [Ilex paraguariensis]|uniref:Uncharacterized protein n=1 Tax=Ilex paraguariensis TaxID=185542 RepID=A0ABC8S746_9AQUA
MSITNYENKFTTLSQFVPSIVGNEEEKWRRFQMGLHFSIRCQICTLELKRYIDLVNKALIAKRDMQEEEKVGEKSKRSRFDLARQATLVVDFQVKVGKFFNIKDSFQTVNKVVGSYAT